MKKYFYKNQVNVVFFEKRVLTGCFFYARIPRMFCALVVKLVDTADSKSAVLRGVLVQVRPRAPFHFLYIFSFYMVSSSVVHVGSVSISNDLPFALIGGPCQIENLDHTLFMADNMAEITSRLNVPFVFKASFDKANRTSHSSKRGVGIEEGLKILEETRKQVGCPVVTDVHESSQCPIVGASVDLVQVPALLCRQTDLLQAAAATGKPVHVKKGQFLSPQDMHNVYKKLVAFGANGVMLCERGTSFGYNTLVSDMRGLLIMAETGAPVIFDATHSVQQPGGIGFASGGERRFVFPLAKAAMAVGVAGIYMEVHQEPDTAPSDGPCMLYLKDLEGVLTTLKRIQEATK